MRLVIVRHGLAGDRKLPGRLDEKRPLTKAGRRKTKASAKGLRRLVPDLRLIASSPWTRAAQTAEILAEELGVELELWDELVPTTPFAALDKRLKGRRLERVAIVGHDPHLSAFASWLLTGKNGAIVRLKKGQAMLIDRRPVGSVLLWSLTAGQLGRMR